MRGENEGSYGEIDMKEGERRRDERDGRGGEKRGERVMVKLEGSKKEKVKG